MCVFDMCESIHKSMFEEAFNISRLEIAKNPFDDVVVVVLRFEHLHSSCLQLVSLLIVWCVCVCNCVCVDVVSFVSLDFLVPKIVFFCFVYSLLFISYGRIVIYQA